MKNIMDLVSLLKKEEHLYIQTHNYPDHDAVASAFALQGIGFGGGHSDMAGGIINDINLFDERKVYDNFMKLLL